MFKFLVITSHITDKAYAISRTLADCHDIANLFANTCTNTSQPINLSTHIGATVSCTGLMRCPGGTSEFDFTASSPCRWQRKLCVTCS